MRKFIDRLTMLVSLTLLFWSVFTIAIITFM